MGGVLECNLNEIVEDYDRISNNKSGKLQLEFIQETQSCLSLNQKDFCSPFSMYFLLDQKIDFVENEVKEADKSAEPHIPDEETEQTEDYVTDLYLHLFQDKSIPQILKDEGYDPQVYHQEERKEKKPKSKNKKGEKGITEEENKKQIEEEKKKETDEIETIKKTNLQQKRQIMRGVLVKERELHLERVNQLWNEFTSIIIKSFEQAKTYGNIDQSKATSGQKEVIHSLNSIRYIWKIFNRLVEDALAVKHATFLNNDKNKDFVIKALKFVESCMQQFTTRPITSFNSIEWKWIRCFFRYCNIVITQCSTDLKQVDFAKNMLPTYMKIIGTMNKFLGVYNESRLSPPDPLLDKKNEDNKMPLIGNYLVGGVDYTNQRIFETHHPYPRGEMAIKDSYVFPKAIAYQIRFDPRCLSDSGNCIFQALTTSQSYWFNDNFGTLYRSSSKPLYNNPVILIAGSKVM